MSLSKPEIHRLVLRKVESAGFEPSGKLALVIADAIYDVLNSRDFALLLDAHISDALRRLNPHR